MDICFLVCLGLSPAVGWLDVVNGCVDVNRLASDILCSTGFCKNRPLATVGFSRALGENIVDRKCRRSGIHFMKEERL